MLQFHTMHSTGSVLWYACTMYVNRDLIRQAYDQTTKAYNLDRQHFRTQKYLTRFLELIPKQSSVLDLGCGAGFPIDDQVLKKGHLLTGIDFSPSQLVLARKNCPTAEYLQKDIALLKPNEFSVDAIICLYTLFHLSRATHAQWLQTIASYLPKNGYILISMGEADFEGWHDFYGQQIWSSQFGPQTNREMLAAAGFEIVLDEIDQSNHEKHQIIIAQKT